LPATSSSLPSSSCRKAPTGTQSPRALPRRDELQGASFTLSRVEGPCAPTQGRPLRHLCNLRLPGRSAAPITVHLRPSADDSPFGRSASLSPIAAPFPFRTPTKSLLQDPSSRGRARDGGSCLPVLVVRPFPLRSLRLRGDNQVVAPASANTLPHPPSSSSPHRPETPQPPISAISATRQRRTSLRFPALRPFPSPPRPAIRVYLRSSVDDSPPAVPLASQRLLYNLSLSYSLIPASVHLGPSPNPAPSPPPTAPILHKPMPDSPEFAP